MVTHKAITEDPSVGKLEQRLLAEFIFELNVARRHLTFYPKTHPVIASCLQRVVKVLDEIFEVRDELTVGVAKDKLILKHGNLDNDSVAFHELASVLFKHGIAVFTMTKGLTVDELTEFIVVISRQARQLQQEGGIESVLHQAGVRSIKVQCLDYNLFQIEEYDGTSTPSAAQGSRDTDTLWQRFVEGLLENTLKHSAKTLDLTERLDPLTLAGMINELGSSSEAEKGLCYDQAVTAYFSGLDREEVLRDARSMAKLGHFVKSLRPELRSRFLNSSLQAFADRSELAETVLSQLPEAVIREALERNDSQGSYVPPAMLKILHCLAGNGSSKREGCSATSGSASTHEELLTKFGLIFREDDTEDFLPLNYRKTPQRAAAEDFLVAPELSGIGELRETLLEHRIQMQVANIVLDLIQADMQEFQADGLKTTFHESCSYFLQLGDFSTLLEIHARIAQRACKEEASESDKQLAEIFAEPEFTGGILNSARLWGKGKFTEIGKLIQAVGDPMIEPLLDELAKEEGISLRRFYMDQLVSLGQSVREAALKRLGDQRWYFVRNLLIILRSLNDKSILPHLRVLELHPRLQVRQELLKTLIHFESPDADRLLLQDIKSLDPQRKMNALALSGRCRTQEVIVEVIKYLTSGSVNAENFEIKRAAVWALAQTGDPSALRAFQQVLHTKNIFNMDAKTQLKLEILAALEKCPSAAVEPILTKIAQGWQGTLTRKAQETLKTRKWQKC